MIDIDEENKTLQRILRAAEAEFLEKGFQNASLRSIVKAAGVTTGAFYRYYPTKEALFEALVKPHADAVKAMFSEALAYFEGLPSERQTGAMTDVSSGCLSRMLDYIYDHYDSFKLLICASGGTVYESFIHDLVELEVESTYRYIQVLEGLGHTVPYVDEELCHMISSGLFSGIFEMVIHDMKKEDAEQRVFQLREFYTGGWERILGVQFGK